MIDDHRAGGGHRLLHNCAAGFADEKMTRAQETWKFFAPPDDVERPSRQRADVLDRFAQAPVATDGDGQLNAPDARESMDHFGRVCLARVDQIEDAPTAGIGGRGTGDIDFGELRTDGKAEGLDLPGRNPRGVQHRRAALVWQEKIIGAAAIPNRIHRERVRDHHDALAARRLPDGPKHLVEHVGIGGINRDNHIRCELRE